MVINVILLQTNVLIIRGCHRVYYHPFGMQIKERTWSGSESRYGFNGKEQDIEVSGSGNQYDYGFRIYNPRLGKFLSVDPLFQSFPWYSPYQFAGNNPIRFVDLDGLETSDPQNPEHVDNGSVESNNAVHIAANSVPEDALITMVANENTNIDISTSGAIPIVPENGVLEYSLDGNLYRAVFSTETGAFAGYAMYGPDKNNPKLSDLDDISNGAQSIELDGAASVFAVLWIGALAEPTPVGEAVMTLATAAGCAYYGTELIIATGKLIEQHLNNYEGTEDFGEASGAEHTNNARPSTRNRHEEGQAAKKKSRGGEKGDKKRRPPRKKPDGWKGPWPPKN